MFNLEDRKIVFICNGEIYNFKELSNKYDLEHLERNQPISIENRDCIVIPLLYIKLGFQRFCDLFQYEIRGEFAFAIFEFDLNYNIK